MPSVRTHPLNRRIWRSRPSLWWAGISTKSWSRAIRRSSGGVPAHSCPPLLSAASRCAFVTIITYFNDRYQGIPEGGYTPIFEKLLDGIDVRLNCDYFDHRDELRAQCRKVVFTGPIDRYFDYCYGPLQFRSLRFESEVLDMENYQGNAVVNYTDRETPYTRVIEHKHFEFGTQPKTVITREYPMDWHPGDEPYYTVNDEENNQLYQRYAALAEREPDVLFGGRLGEYKYYDMDKVIASALGFAARELN